MPDAAPNREWISLALALFFLMLGAGDLLLDPPNPSAAVWELMLAAANALLYWGAKGGPGWARVLGQGLVVGGVAAAVADLFL